MKRQVLLCEPEVKGSLEKAREFTDNTVFWVNQDFALMWVLHAAFPLFHHRNLALYYFCPYSKNGKAQKRGKINLVGRLQLSTDKSKEEDNEGIIQLRILRVQVRMTTRCIHTSCLLNIGPLDVLN